MIGNLHQIVHCLGIGTGACTDIIQMHNAGADVCLVSDDGINNWVHTQGYGSSYPTHCRESFDK